MLFFGKFYVTKKSKNDEIVFRISKAKSGSIAIKIRKPFLWTDPYLHCLTFTPASCFSVTFKVMPIRVKTKEDTY